MNKNASIDAYKGLLIIFVVAGHVAGALMPFATGVGSLVLDVAFKSIYSFHMAAFFVVAGYASAKYGSGDGQSLGTFFCRKFRRLLVPYFVFGIISAIVWFATCTESRPEPWRPFLSLLHAGGWPDGLGFRCNSVLWFLPAMFMTVMCGHVLESWIHRRLWPLLLLCISLVPLTGFIVRQFGVANWPWGLVVLPRWLSFYLVGRIVAILSCKKDVMKGDRGWGERWRLLGIPVIVVVAMSTVWLRENGWANRPLFSYIAWLSSLVGTALSAAIACCLVNPFWGQVGKCSLGIMLLHKFVIVAAVRLLLSGGGASFGWSVMLLFCAITFVATYVSRSVSTVILKYCPILLGGGK